MTNNWIKGKAGIAKRKKKCKEARAAKALIIQQNDEDEEETVDQQTTVALPAPPNPLATLEEINFYRQVP
uniref:Uncharacterized protein n=1 Tax=Panagrolaimus sp. PS1159 TaxID=55785 RepID=A0AC35FZ86_9BILA